MSRYAAMQPIRLFPAVFAAVLLAGCSSTPSPRASEPARAGVDQSATVLQTLPPPASNRQYDPGIAPDNQKTQKEKDKEAQAAIEKDLDRKRADDARQQNADERKTIAQ
jgi:outer membrane murein-binding lipoprotein Lpp